jgi:type II secretory pathway component PulK
MTDTHEVEILRGVYEAARKLLRYNGIDKQKVAEAVDELEDWIDEVKYFDGGGYAFDHDDT